MSELFAVTGSGAGIVRMTIESVRHTAVAHHGNERDRTDALAESRTLIRAITSLIDPDLYFGRAYGLMRGNALHRELYDRVQSIMERAAAFPDYDENAYAVALGALRDLCGFWPQDRDTLISARQLV